MRFSSYINEGANEFSITVKANSPEEAFRKAIDHARYESGHGGYSGTIAEKSKFIMVTTPKGKNPQEYAQELMDDDPRISDKWGPAGCIKLENGDYFFFGWASS